MCGDSPSAPDNTELAKATEESARIMAQQADKDLQFRREQYANLLPYLQNQLGIGVDQARTQAQIAKDNRDNALEDRSYYESTYKPVELASVKDAFGYSYLSDDDAAAFDQAMSTQSRNKITGDFDSRLAAINSDRAAYQKQMEAYEKAMADAKIDRKAIEDELRGKFTYERAEAQPDGQWVSTTDGGYAYAPFSSLGNLRPNAAAKTVKTVDQEGLNKAVQSRVDELLKQQGAAGKPIDRDFDAELAELERTRTTAMNDEDANLAMAAQQRKAQRAAEESEAKTTFDNASAQTGMATQQAKRNLMKLGINPNSAKFASLGLTAANDSAATAVAGANQARTQLKDKLIGLRAGVGNFGRNQTNAAAGAFTTAVGAGATAANTAGAGVGNSLNTANYVSGGTANQMQAQQAAIQANLGLAGLNNQAYQIAANQSNGFGEMLGFAGNLATKFI